MKQYKFELIINEGNDEFWEDIKDRNVTGCDEVREAIAETLSITGWLVDGEYADCELKLIEYKDIQ